MGTRFSLVGPVLVLLAVSPAACSRDNPSGPSAPRPAFNHVQPPAMPNVSISVNRFLLTLAPDQLLGASHLGRTMLWGGGLEYGTGGTAMVHYDQGDPYGTPPASGLLPVYGPVVWAPGTAAAHQTLSLLVEYGQTRRGANTPPGLVTVRETFAFTATADTDYVIVKYTLFNPGPAAVTGLHVGQTLDPDVIDANQNCMLFNGDGSAWTFQPDSAPRFGHAMLTDVVTSTSVWFNNTAGPTGDATDYATAFERLSGGLWTTTCCTCGGDLRHLLSTGPLTIQAGQARVVAFALAAAGDGSALTAVVDAARERWAGLPAASRGPVPLVQVRVSTTPTTLLPGVTGEQRVSLVFPTAALAARFQRGSARCAGALAARDTTWGRHVVLTIDRMAFDATVPHGRRMWCGGVLSDGSLWVGADSVGLKIVVTPVRRVTSDTAADRHGSWSPSGRHIVFVSARGGTAALWRLDVTLGESSARALTTSSVGDDNPAWSPDGSRIVFTRDGGLFTVSASGGDTIQMTARSAAAGGRRDVRPTWSPDGTQLAFGRVIDSVTQVFVLPAVPRRGEFRGSVARQVTTGGRFSGAPEWEADGLVYFQSAGRADDTTQAIFRVDPAVGEASVERVTPIEGVQNVFAALSPDGTLLAFQSQVPQLGGTVIVLQNMMTGAHEVLTFDVAVHPAGSHMEFSPNGRWLLFSDGRDLWRADIANRRMVRVM